MRTKKELMGLKMRLGFYDVETISQEEEKQLRNALKDGVQTLPDDILLISGTFYRIIRGDLDDSEYSDYLLSKQTQMIQTIKNCCIFLALLAIAGPLIRLLIAMH